jgi:hypothetical protein
MLIKLRKFKYGKKIPQSPTRTGLVDGIMQKNKYKTRCE